jgi:hypothetical protein
MRVNIGTCYRMPQMAIRYLEQIQGRSVFPSQDSLNNLTRLGGPLPDHGEAPSSILSLLDEFGSPATVRTAGGRYFGFVVGGAVPSAVAAHWLANASDQNASLYVGDKTCAAALWCGTESA